MTDLSNDSSALALGRQKKAEQVRMIYQEHPQLREVEQALMAQIAALTRAMALLSSEGKIAAANQNRVVAEVQARIAELSLQRKLILESLKLPDDYAQLEVACDLCRDTGLVSVDGQWHLCSCRLEQQRARKQLHAGITKVLQRKTFANFTLDHYALLRSPDAISSAYESAAKALEACRLLVEEVVQGRGEKGLYLFGRTGVGKTHLAAATANALLERGVDVRYVVSTNLLDSLRATINDGSDAPRESDIMDELSSVPVLIIDDVASESYSAWAVDRIYQIVNMRYNKGLPLILTTNVSISSLAEAMGDDQIASRIASRVAEMCRIFHLVGDDMRLLLRS